MSVAGPKADEIGRYRTLAFKVRFSTECGLTNGMLGRSAFSQERTFGDSNSKSDENIDTFEVDSIELTNPELFSDKEEDNSFNQDYDLNEQYKAC